MSKGGCTMDNDEVLKQVEQPKKKKGKKKWIIIAAVAVLVIIIFAFSGNDKPKVETPSDQSNDSSQSSDADSNGTTQDDTQQIKVGSSVTDDELKITFKSCNADFKKYHKYADIKKGCKVIQATFTFENISSSDVLLDNFECYADGDKCEEFYSVDDYSSPTLETVSPNRKLTSIVYYQVPKDAKEIEIEYERNSWTSEKYIFVVK